MCNNIKDVSVVSKECSLSIRFCCKLQYFAAVCNKSNSRTFLLTVERFAATFWGICNAFALHSYCQSFSDVVNKAGNSKREKWEAVREVKISCCHFQLKCLLILIFVIQFLSLLENPLGQLPRKVFHCLTYFQVVNYLAKWKITLHWQHMGQ